MNAQVAVSSELYQIFLEKDRVLFEEGFNKCNLVLLEEQLDPDLEFYHDVAGIQSKTEFLEAMTNNICSSPERKPIRKLVPNTMKVFPLYDNGVLYGAIVEGSHEFYIKETDKPLYKTGSALFSGLWMKKGDDWKAKHLYSFHHQPAE